MEVYSIREQINPLVIAGGFAALFLAYQIGFAVYNVYFSPLAHIPGPWYSAITRLPYVHQLQKGTTGAYLRKLHEQYGDVVRYSPDEVSFISGETAWQDIYGFRTGKSKGTESFQKNPVFYGKPPNGVPSMLLAADQPHGRMRRTISHAFSDKALREQEPLIQRYADLLIDRLKEVTSESPTHIADMKNWLNWTTFDIISDLLFGVPFGCLANAQTHEYVQLLLDGLKGFSMVYFLYYFPWASKYLGSLVVDKHMIARRMQFSKWTYSQVRKRAARETQRPDFMTYILAHKDGDGVKSGISEDEMDSNGTLFLTAGTETTAHTLAIATHLTLTHPDIYHKLKEEIRGRFTKNEEITIDAANELEYTIAVLTEALRFLPPVPAGFSRKVPEGGATVSGHYLPGNTGVSMTHYAAYRSERNFKDPDLFVPDRWLGAERYKDDNRATFQPCLGKNLAYAELRVIFAKLIFHFDMELSDESRNWMDGFKLMGLWVKGPLYVKLTPVAP